MASISSARFNRTLHLAIDQGGQSTRVAVYTRSGQPVCVFSSPCATRTYQRDDSAYPFIEQEGADILAGIRTCLQKIQQQLGADVQHIVSAGFAGQGSSLLCWNNQTGETLTPVLSWQDIRGEAYLNNIPINHTQIQQLTGLRLSPHYGASKMRWCLEHNEKVAQAQQDNCLSIGPIVSYIFWHLLDGASATHKQSLVDPGHAQRTLLWNLTRNEWDQSLLEMFNIPCDVLPNCLCHNSHFGNLQLGDHTIPFAASARDQGASLFARGLPEPDTCYINIGTGAFIQRLSENLHAPEGLLVSPLWLSEKELPKNESPENPAAKKYYAWEATVNGAAAAISFIQQQTDLAVTPEDITAALELNPSGECYFLNAVGGLSAPYWRTDLQSQFSENLSAAEKVLAWIESVIFQIVINVQLMNHADAVKKIIISGGFSKADAVCQKIADLTRATVHRSDNADATLQGIACMAAGLAEEWQPALQEDVFLPQHNKHLQQRFSHWKLAMDNWLK